MSRSPRMKEGVIFNKNKPHKKTAVSANMQLMKWNDWIEKYHHLRQTHLINNSFNLVYTFFKEKQDTLRVQIEDVPFIESEQAFSSEQLPNEKKQSSSESIYTQDEQLQESAGSENFTDQEDEEIQTKKEQKSTNKNSSVRWENDDIENLRRTACFAEDNMQKQNLNSNTEEMIRVYKRLQEKSQRGRKMQKTLKEDKKYLRRFVERSKK